MSGHISLAAKIGYGSQPAPASSRVLRLHEKVVADLSDAEDLPDGLEGRLEAEVYGVYECVNQARNFVEVAIEHDNKRYVVQLPRESVTAYG